VPDFQQRLSRIQQQRGSLEFSIQLLQVIRDPTLIADLDNPDKQSNAVTLFKEMAGRELDYLTAEEADLTKKDGLVESGIERITRSISPASARKNKASRNG
jgi:hypothetical protein